MPNTGLSPVNYATTVGQVRAVIGDDDAINVAGGEGEYVWYSDAAIEGLLTVFSDSPLRASAQALRTIASSQALLLKKWSTDDLSVDGAAIAEAMRKLAADLDEQATSNEASLDIFQISYPGENTGFIPEGLPAGFGLRWGRIAVENGWAPTGDAWIIIDGGYVVDQ